MTNSPESKTFSFSRGFWHFHSQKAPGLGGATPAIADRSQFIEVREHLDPQFVVQLRDEAAYWGKSIGIKYGEPYTSREPIGLTDFVALI